jgi:hypothetical protein
MSTPDNSYPTADGQPAADHAPTNRIFVPQQHQETAPVRRPTKRFLPPPPPEQKETAAIARDFARGKRRDSSPKLGRKRKIAGDLPSWDPMPPGESLVVRRSAP